MRVAGLVRIAVVLCLSLALLPLVASAQSPAEGAFNAAAAAIRNCGDVAGCGSSSTACLGIGEGSPCGPKNKGTCVALACSSVLTAVCKCDTSVISVDPADDIPVDLLQVLNSLSGSCVRQ
jgi:hypothetical protein